VQPRYGTQYIEHRGRLTRIVDRTQAVQAELTWGDGLERLAVTGATLHGRIVDPLLREAHALGTTAISAIDWAHPTQIPTVADPARLPPGSGGMILNVLAVLAARAGIAALRYAGPYPTPALWHALARSFCTTASEEQFTAGVLERALRVARDELPFDFAPAPFERIATACGWVELREGLERAVIDGVTYDRAGSVARLGEHAEVWIGDALYARVATFDASGALIDGPHAIPPCTSAVLGREFPPALRAALAELVADAVPSPIAALAREAIATRTLAWADLGARVARRTEHGFAVHAALWERIAPLGLARLALALAEALAPEASRLVVGELARASVTP
jgi:hypothetical protein